jgi:hypothetical protein
MEVTSSAFLKFTAHPGNKRPTCPSYPWLIAIKTLKFPMNRIAGFRIGLGMVVGVWLLPLPRAVAADFTVTAVAATNAFFINGVGLNPTITLVRGSTYTFAVNTYVLHPFAFSTKDAGGFATGETPEGVQNNHINAGTVTFQVPTNAVDCLYWCSFHFFSGNVIMIDPPTPAPPPTVQILGLSLGSSLVVTSTGTNTWTPFPEFSTNLTGTNWFALTVQSNRFSNGTNETFCGRPPGEAVFIRVRAQSN